MKKTIVFFTAFLFMIGLAVLANPPTALAHHEEMLAEGATIQSPSEVDIGHSAVATIGKADMPVLASVYSSCEIKNGRTCIAETSHIDHGIITQDIVPNLFLGAIIDSVVVMTQAGGDYSQGATHAPGYIIRPTHSSVGDRPVPA